MRQKASPQFLSKRRCNDLSFSYFHVSASESDISEAAHGLKKRKRKLDLRKKLVAAYEHSLILYMHQLPVSSVCLQSIQLPLMSTVLNYFCQSKKVEIFFDTSSSTLCFEDNSTPPNQFLIAADLSDVAFLLYGASASCFILSGTVEPNFLRIDVHLKEGHLLSTAEFFRHPISQTQFSKVLNFVTLQEMPFQVSLDDVRLPLFDYGSETQEEFVCCLKLLYDCVQEEHNLALMRKQIIQPCEIKIKLLAYQLDAINWMLSREKSSKSPVDSDWLFSFFLPITDIRGNQKPVIFSSVTGHFLSSLPTAPGVCLGGILADEMGLGKTLEIISIVLLHPMDDGDRLGQLRTASTGTVLSSEKAFKLACSTSCKHSPNDFPEDVLSNVSPASSHTSTEPMHLPEGEIFCTCGNGPETLGLPTVACSRCMSPFLQHIACVQFEMIQNRGFRAPAVHSDYICPQCWSGLRVFSKATLIVSPDHIWRQWQDELLEHVKIEDLVILVYEGINAPVNRLKTGPVNQIWRSETHSPGSKTPQFSPKDATAQETYFRPGFVQPTCLAAADIVLTTYSIVQRELDWAAVATEQRTGEGHRPQLRTAQRYLAPPSPLACVVWWRLCLDEAQMVENVTSKTAKMVSEVSAVHRWCVTGTPAEKSVDDFYGLLAYLRVEPFCFRHYWNSMLYQPFLKAVRGVHGSPSVPHNEKRITATPTLKEAVANSALARLLRQFLWRNTKSLVGSQLTLPIVSERIHWVTFSSVERYIHDRVLGECRSALEQVLQSELSKPRSCVEFAVGRDELLEQPLAALPGPVHWRIVALVTRARQACTHASLVVLNSSNLQSAAGGRPNRSRSTSAIDGNLDNSRCSVDPALSLSRNNRFQGTGCATMTEVIRRVVDETRQECESGYRSWVFNKNGAAGCFILLEKFILAANCYRDVLRTAIKLEKKHGVLADWSQRLHAITNLHWLMQCCSVPPDELEQPLPSIGSADDQKFGSSRLNSVTSEGTADDEEDLCWERLDPRVDRDLVAKAKLLRLDYLKLHSRLLSKAREKLDLVLGQVEKHLLLLAGSQDDWLSILSETMEGLSAIDTLDRVPAMLSASFQGRSGFLSQFKTTLLYTTSGQTFKSLLLVEMDNLLKARRNLRSAMEPLDRVWKTFNECGEADRCVLEKYYACCAREFDLVEGPTSNVSNSGLKKQKRRFDATQVDELSAKSPTGLQASRKKRVPRSARCDLCLANEALHHYRQVLNHERPSNAPHSTRSQRTAANERLLSAALDCDDLDTIEDADEELSKNADLTAVGLVNPFIVALQIVSAQMSRLPTPCTVAPGLQWKQLASRFDRLLQLLVRELMLTGRVQSLTKEWWNVHDDAEQFVIRLQATSPTDLAFIPPEEVEVQLHQQSVEALNAWSHLQTRLGHLSFLRNALREHSISASGGSDSSDAVIQLECPTCLTFHSPARPTFVLLPGCWHNLCLLCYERIRGLPVPAHRRCPICRMAFAPSDAFSRAIRRQPLTLLHFGGGNEKGKITAKENAHVGEDISDDGVADVLEEVDRIIGDHSSKVREVVRCLKSIKKGDTDAKAVVFSSWLSILYTMAHALDQNGIAYTSLFKAKDARNLAGFRCAGSRTWVLLLPIQLGANGLNLTEANHVLLVDPVLNQGRETQAIARVHRIGQTRPCLVHRFIVRGSIETALHGVHSKLPLVAETDCMVGAGARRSSSTSSGTAGPSEDRAHLLQMTVSQLMGLLDAGSLTPVIDELISNPISTSSGKLAHA